MSSTNLFLKPFPVEEDAAPDGVSITINSDLSSADLKDQGLCRRGASIQEIIKRFLGYLTGDSLNYALGFFIYAWLIRILTNSQYADLSIATSIYQVLMMVAAMGIDLVGPGLLSDHPNHIWALVGKFERIRVGATVLICIPIILLLAMWYWQHGRVSVAILVIASSAMVFSRVIDISYVAIACGMPAALAKSRVLGLSTYMVILFALTNASMAHLWLIPVFNAAGIAIGRVFLKRRLRSVLPKGEEPVAIALKTRHILGVGARSGLGQLIMLGFQTLDILYLSFYAKPGDLGQYAMMARLYLFGTAALTAVFNAFVPVFLNDADFYRGLRRSIWFSTVVGVVGFIGFAAIGSGLAEFFAHRPLPAAHGFAIWFGVAYLALGMATPIYLALAILKCEQEYVITMLLGAGALVVVDLVLVPRIGLTGGAIGQIAASAVVLVASLAFVLSKAVRLRLVPAGVH